MMRGSARCTGSSGLGDTAAYIPAGGGPARGANSVSRAVRSPDGGRGVYGAYLNLFRCRRFGGKSTPLVRAVSPPTTAVEGVLGVFRERFGGAFASQSPYQHSSLVPDLLASRGCSTRCAGGPGPMGRYPPGRIPRSASDPAVPPS